MTEKEYIITGMTCASCSSHVQRAVSKLPGIESCTVNLATEKMSVTFAPDQVNDTILKTTVENAGYGFVEPIQNKQAELAIDGMTCAACSSGIERILRKKDGIASISVNLTTGRGLVEYDPQKIKLTQIKSYIVDAGYGANEVEGTKTRDMEAERREKEVRTMRLKLIIAIVFATPELYIAMSHMIPFLKLPVPSFMNMHMFPLTFALVQLVLTIPVLFAGNKFFRVGFKTLSKGAPNMDTLIAIGTGTAFLYSLFATIKVGLGDFEFVQSLYYESAAVVITLVMLGKYLETLSKGKTSEAIKKLMNLRPKTAFILKGDQEIEVAIDELSVGDLIVLRPGSVIPVDGVVTDGISTVDESMLTGESLPIEKTPGSKVTGGSINGEGLLHFIAEYVGSETTLSKIIKMVEDAQGKKAPIAKLADIVAGYFVPIVLGIAAISSIGWALAGKDFNFVLTIFVSILVIACPCALGLATPTAIMVGTGKGAELGIFIKSGEALESTHKITTVVLDKTGTITEGKPVLTDLVTYNQEKEDTVLQLCASAEQGSEHPVAKAVVDHAQKREYELLRPESFKAVLGRGILATVSSQEILAGNLKLMQENSVDTTLATDDALRLSSKGRTLLYVAKNGILVALIAVADQVKPGSKAAIARLKAMGIKVAMITGDNHNTAMAIGEEVGIETILSEVLPEDKSNEVKKLQEKGESVAMVGDGINDAPALVQADIGMAIGTGTDVAVESADVVLMKGDLNEVSVAIALSRVTLRNIKQNLFWAFIYNTAGIPFAAGVFYLFGGPLLNPIFAGAAMAFSSVSVVSNALRLRYFK